MYIYIYIHVYIYIYIYILYTNIGSGQGFVPVHGSVCGHVDVLRPRSVLRSVMLRSVGSVLMGAAFRCGGFRHLELIILTESNR